MNVIPKISIVFVNYRSVKYLRGALASLFFFERDTSFFEVIVVNNDANESVSLQALNQEYPFLLRESGGNLGFGRGNNLGVKDAQGEIIAFINPDVLWTGVHLKKITRIFERDRTIGVMGMALLTEEKNSESWSAGRAPSLANLACNNLISVWREPRAEHGHSVVDWVSGGGLCIRKNLFSAIGGFDERFFLYFEDVDLCAEVRRRGFLVVRRSDLPLVHLGGKSKHSTRLQKKYFYASQKQYFDKWRPGLESKVLSWLQFLCHRV